MFGVALFLAKSIIRFLETAISLFETVFAKKQQKESYAIKSTDVELTDRFALKRSKIKDSKLAEQIPLNPEALVLSSPRSFFNMPDIFSKEDHWDILNNLYPRARRHSIS